VFGVKMASLQGWFKMEFAHQVASKVEQYFSSQRRELFGFVVLHNKLCFSWFPSHSFAFVSPIPLSIKLHFLVLFSLWAWQTKDFHLVLNINCWLSLSL